MTRYLLALLCLLLTGCLLPVSPAYAASTLQVGQYVIQYDQSFNDDIDGNGSQECTSYYLDGNLVFSAWDTDENGIPDLWFRYDGEEYLDLELADHNGDGQPDEIAMVDRDENVKYLQPDNNNIWESWGIIAIAAIGLIAVALIVILVKKGRSIEKGGPGNDKHL